MLGSESWNRKAGLNSSSAGSGSRFSRHRQDLLQRRNRTHTSVPAAHPRSPLDVEIHAYSMAGKYDLKLTVRDDDGGASMASILVII